MKLRVLNEKVLVRVNVEEEKVTEGGIIVSAVKHDRKYEGWVEGVGTNPDIAKFGIKPGVYVIYPKGLNDEKVIDGVTYDIVSVYDICAIVEEM